MATVPAAKAMDRAVATAVRDLGSETLKSSGLQGLRKKLSFHSTKGVSGITNPEAVIMGGALLRRAGAPVSTPASKVGLEHVN